MKKLIILLALFFCSCKLHAQEKNDIYGILNILSEFSSGLSTHPEFGTPFANFLNDTARIKKRLAIFEKYFGADTFAVSCLMVKFPFFGVRNEPSVLWSQDQLKNFLEKNPRSIVGINKFFGLHKVDYDSMYQHFFNPGIKNYNKEFIEYAQDDATVFYMEKNLHDFYGISDTGVVNFSHKVNSISTFMPQIGKELVPLITMLDLQLQLVNMLELKNQKTKMYLLVPSTCVLHIDWIARSLNTKIPMCMLYSD